MEPVTVNKLQPIFIGGCGRSGTTMLASMLGVNNQVIVTPESQFKIELPTPNSFDIEKLVKWLRSNKRFAAWNMNLDSARYKSQNASYSQQEFMNWLVWEFAHQTMSEGDYKYWVDHTPLNILTYEKLFKIYPEAKIVNLVRDGRAVASSVLPLDWGPTTILGASDFWRESIVEGANAENMYPDNVMRVHYESLLLNTEETLEKLCLWLGITFSPDMCSSSGFAVPSVTKKQHALVGKGVDKSRLSAWRNKLTAREIECFEAECSEMLIRFGYELENSHPRKASLLNKLWFSIDGKIKKKRQRAKYRKRLIAGEDS